MIDKELLTVYMQGFNDELNSIKSINLYKKNQYIQKAYDLGREHAYIGDDVPSLDNLTNSEILKMIYEKS